MTPEQAPEVAEQISAQHKPSKSKRPRFVMWQVGKIKDMNQEFDVAYWQAQDTTARLNAGWELVVYYLTRQGRTDELRLQRSIGSLQRKSG